MASFNKLPSGLWRAQVRRRGQQVSKCFRLKSEAAAWALETETVMISGKSPKAARFSEKSTFGVLIDLHIDDMKDVGKPPQRSKRKSLEKLKRDLGRISMRDFTRERLIAYGKARLKEGAGPVTISADIGYVRTILIHATAIHGIQTPTENVLLARVALRRLGLIGKGNERDRRPTQDELSRIIAYADGRSQKIGSASELTRRTMDKYLSAGAAMRVHSWSRPSGVNRVWRRGDRPAPHLGWGRAIAVQTGTGRWARISGAVHSW